MVRIDTMALGSKRPVDALATVPGLKLPQIKGLQMIEAFELAEDTIVVHDDPHATADPIPVVELGLIQIQRIPAFFQMS